MTEAARIVLSGRSGTGKSTIAQALACSLRALWLRIDTIEQAIKRAKIFQGYVDDAGYLVAYGVAEDNLRLGRIVIADCVNDWIISRDAWRNVGLQERANVLEVEVICSDVVEHRRRVDARASDISGLHYPDWQTTMARGHDPWERSHLIIDTASQSIEACVAVIREKLTG